MATPKTTTNMFERAVRLRLRVGQFSVEDLWDLPLKQDRARNAPSLDTIALELNKTLRAEDEVVSFVDESAVSDFKTQLSFDIVRYIIDTKKREAQDALNDQQRTQLRREIDEALERKRTGKYENMTEKDLLEQRRKLG